MSRFKSDTEIGIQKANVKLRRNGCKALGEEQFWSRARGGGGGGGREGGGVRLRSSEQRGPALSGAMSRDPTGRIALTTPPPPPKIPPLTTAERGVTLVERNSFFFCSRRISLRRAPISLRL